MSDQIIVVMDDIARINIKKDTTFALLLEAQRRAGQVWYATEDDLSMAGGDCIARLRPVTVQDDPQRWFELGEPLVRSLGEGDLVLMRCDPPVDDRYLYATYLLDRAAAAGARVINRPQALRDFNEKLAIARFADLIPDTLVSSRAGDLREFVGAQGQAVLKPLDGMGGRGIFLAGRDDPNLNVIIETLTEAGQRPAMAQQYLPGIADGDKRVMMIGSEPVPYMLARIPGSGDFRGNLARGGRGEGRPLGDIERRIATRVGPVLVEHGILFAGLDVIGDRLTEINVTSPTCVRELDARFGINIAGMLFDAVDRAVPET